MDFSCLEKLQSEVYTIAKFNHNRYTSSMARTIQSELKQKKPFTSKEEELFLNIIRTADQLQRGATEVLEIVDLTRSQYNALRILRGAGEKGCACGEISERMISHDPDITRLLDRLEKRLLVARNRDATDRRIVITRILPQGLDLLKKLDEPVNNLHKFQLGHLSSQDQDALIKLLEKARYQEKDP